MSTTPDALFNLADAMAEDILNTPDDEVLREVEEDFGDPRALANKFDLILERAEKQATRPAASPQVRSSVLDLLYRLREWLSTPQFQLPVKSVVWASAAAVLIAVMLASAVLELEKRSEQLATLEKQLAVQADVLLREQLAARGVSSRDSTAPSAAELSTAPAQAAQTQLAAGSARPICEKLTEPIEHLICADADLAFWQNLVSEIYQHKWGQLDANGQQILRQGELDWLRNMRVNCYVVPATGAWNAAEMARAKSCVLQSIKERVAVLSNN